MSGSFALARLRFPLVDVAHLGIHAHVLAAALFQERAGLEILAAHRACAARLRPCDPAIRRASSRAWLKIRESGEPGRDEYTAAFRARHIIGRADE